MRRPKRSLAAHVGGMTLTAPNETTKPTAGAARQGATNPSRAKALHEFDTARRGEANIAGHPILRAASSPIHSTAVVAVTVHAGRLTTVDFITPYETRTEPLTVQSLNAFFESGRNMLVDEPATFEALLAFARHAVRTAGRDDWAPSRLLSRLEFHRSMPMSTALPTLTQALQHRWYVSERYNTATIDGWAKVFGVSDLYIDKKIQALIEHAMHEHKDYMKGVRTAELNGAKSATFPGLKSQTRAYDALDIANTALEAALALDVALVERNVIEGRLAKVEVTNTALASIGVKVGDDFSIRAGRELIVFPVPGLPAETARLSKVRLVERDGVRMVEGTITPAAKLPPKWMGLVRAGSVLYIAEKPFGGRRGVSPTRWVTDAAGRGTTAYREANPSSEIPKREVPLSVILAGAPVVD